MSNDFSGLSKCNVKTASRAIRKYKESYAYALKSFNEAKERYVNDMREEYIHIRKFFFFKKRVKRKDVMTDNRIILEDVGFGDKFLYIEHKLIDLGYTDKKTMWLYNNNYVSDKMEDLENLVKVSSGDEIFVNESLANLINGFAK